MTVVGGIKSAPPDEVIDTYFALLDFYQWRTQTQRLMEALSRLLAKHQEARYLTGICGDCLRPARNWRPKDRRAFP